MSSGSLSIPTSAEMFEWSDSLNPQNFIFATYKVSSSFSGRETALGMAMEQSAATVYIKNYVESEILESWAIRVRKVSAIESQFNKHQVEPYYLATEVYGGNKESQFYSYEIELAIPACLVGQKPAQLINIIVGELPRLGFLTAFSLVDIAFPKNFSCGPAFGAKGILKLLDKTEGSLVCRSMRPGLGLSADIMAKLNRDVLIGGFHLVKDDELIYFPTNEDFRHHVTTMITARDQAIAITGEKKLYVANLLCEPDELETRWKIACELGVDAVLIAPFIQGLGILPLLAKQAKIPLLAHNTFGDLMTRNSAWGIDDSVVCKILRELGADWIVTPGPFGTDGAANNSSLFIQAATEESNNLRSLMPILQGGKRPQDLQLYLDSVGSKDFMLIVASWVDGHPEGLIEGAKIFRHAIDNLA